MDGIILIRLKKIRFWGRESGGGQEWVQGYTHNNSLWLLLLLAGEEDRMVCAPNLYTNVVPIPFNLKVNIDSGWKRDGIRSGTGSE